jgi:hypothetical protein
MWLERCKPLRTNHSKDSTMHRLASLTTRDLESVTGGASLSEALAGAYAPSDDMSQPNTIEPLSKLPGALLDAVTSGSWLGAAKGIGRALGAVTVGQLKDAFAGKGAPIIAPGL